MVSLYMDELIVWIYYPVTNFQCIYYNFRIVSIKSVISEFDIIISYEYIKYIFLYEFFSSFILQHNDTKYYCHLCRNSSFYKILINYFSKKCINKQIAVSSFIISFC